MSSRRRRGGTDGDPLPPPDRLLRPSSNKGGVRGKSDQRDNEMKKMDVIMIRFFVSDQRQRRTSTSRCERRRRGEGVGRWHSAQSY